MIKKDGLGYLRLLQYNWVHVFESSIVLYCLVVRKVLTRTQTGCFTKYPSSTVSLCYQHALECLTLTLFTQHTFDW